MLARVVGVCSVWVVLLCLCLYAIQSHGIHTLNTCGPRGCASELSSKWSKSFQTLCAVCTDRRPACRRPHLGVIQTMLLLTIA